MRARPEAEVPRFSTDRMGYSQKAPIEFGLSPMQMELKDALFVVLTPGGNTHDTTLSVHPGGWLRYCVCFRCACHCDQRGGCERRGGLYNAPSAGATAAVAWAHEMLPGIRDRRVPLPLVPTMTASLRRTLARSASAIRCSIGTQTCDRAAFR
jgi:hypothetical protein